MPIPPDIALDLFVPPEHKFLVVFVGPCTVQQFHSSKIPLDGRKYVSHGDITLKTGTMLRARVVIDTTDFDFLELDGTYVSVDGLWYRWDEEELYIALGTPKEASLPFVWSPDTPLDHHEPPPYPMTVSVPAGP
jgi:hypothetical protein